MQVTTKVFLKEEDLSNHLPLQEKKETQTKLKSNQGRLYAANLHNKPCITLNGVSPCAYLGSTPLKEFDYKARQSKINALSATQVISYANVPLVPSLTSVTIQEAISLVEQRKEAWLSQLDKLPSLGSCDKNKATAFLQDQVKEYTDFYSHDFTKTTLPPFIAEMVTRHLHELDHKIVSFVRQKGVYNQAPPSDPIVFEECKTPAIFFAIKQDRFSKTVDYAELKEGSKNTDSLRSETKAAESLINNDSYIIGVRGNLRANQITKIGRMIDGGFSQEEAAAAIAVGYLDAIQQMEP